LYATAPWLRKKAWNWESLPDTIQERSNTAVELIKAGKEEGVDEMRITLD
jgi:hypothetical protein